MSCNNSRSHYKKSNKIIIIIIINLKKCKELKFLNYIRTIYNNLKLNNFSTRDVLKTAS